MTHAATDSVKISAYRGDTETHRIDRLMRVLTVIGLYREDTRLPSLGAITGLHDHKGELTVFVRDGFAFDGADETFVFVASIWEGLEWEHLGRVVSEAGQEVVSSEQWGISYWAQFEEQA